MASVRAKFWVPAIGLMATGFLPAGDVALATEGSSILAPQEIATSLCADDRFAGALNGDVDACSRERGRNGFMVSMAQKFCSHPRDFCSEVRTMATDPARGADRYSKFVGPNCEPAFRPGMMSDLNGPGDNADSASMAHLMYNSWGCRPPTRDTSVLVRADGNGRPYIQWVMNCDPAKVPFYCGTNQMKASPDTPEDDLRMKAASDALRASGAVSRVMEGGVCSIFAGEGPADAVPANGAPSLPSPLPGETYTHYIGRIHLSSDQQAEFNRRLERATAKYNQALNSGARLLGHGSARFRMATRSVITPGKIHALETMLAAAKEGMEDYLRHLTPPAPQAVIDRMNSVKLFNYRAFLESPPSEAAREAMNELEAQCRDGNSDNAFGHPGSVTMTPRGTKDAPYLSICPATLADIDLSNPRSMLPRLLQLLTMPVLPCEMGRTTIPNMAGPGDTENCPRDPMPDGAYPAATRAQFQEFRRREERYTRCVTADPSSPPSGAMAQPGPDDSALVTQLRDQLKACSAWNNTCALDHYANPRDGGGGGEARGCRSNWATFPVPANCPDAAATLERLKASAYNQQSGQELGQYIASQALGRALASPRLQAQMPTTDVDKQSDILTSLSAVCFPGFAGTGPDPRYLSSDLSLSIFASNPDVRARAGCDRLDPPAAHPESAAGDFPAAACGSNLQGLPAPVDMGF